MRAIPYHASQEFLDSFHHGGMRHLDAAWEESQHQQRHHQHLGPPEAHFDEFEQIFSGLSLQGPQGERGMEGSSVTRASSTCTA